MGEWFFHDNQKNAAAELVTRYHYSGRMAGVVVIGTAHEAGGLFGDYGPAFAACCFGSPPARWSEDVLELQRLVCHPDYRGFPLSSLIAKTAALCRRRGHDLLVSFADVGQDHHGGVYQASSWAYHGCRPPRMEGVEVDGVFIPGRTSNARYGTRSPQKLREQGVNAVGVFDQGKHLYWRALTKRGRSKAKRLGLEKNPYPRPDE